MLPKISKPDILIVDMMMPGLNGLDVIKQVTRRSPNTRIIVLSMQTDETYVLGALKHGADGYVLKESSAEHLVTAIHTVLEGNRYLSEPLTERAIDAYIDQASQQQTEDPYEQLTTTRTRSPASRRRKLYQPTNCRTLEY
jgi:two-component system response regulator NreC